MQRYTFHVPSGKFGWITIQATKRTCSLEFHPNLALGMSGGICVYIHIYIYIQYVCVSLCTTDYTDFYIYSTSQRTQICRHVFSDISLYIYIYYIIYMYLENQNPKNPSGQRKNLRYFEKIRKPRFSIEDLGYWFWTRTELHPYLTRTNPYLTRT